MLYLLEQCSALPKHIFIHVYMQFILLHILWEDAVHVQNLLICVQDSFPKLTFQRASTMNHREVDVQS